MSNGLKQVKNNMQATQDARVASPTGVLQQQQVNSGEAISPKLQREIDVYNTAVVKLLHSKETQPSIMKMLSSGPIEESIPATAIQVNEQLKQTMKPAADVMLAGSVTLVSDLIEMSEASGLVETTPTEAEITQIYQDTLQKYIHAGIKSGDIDPVQLQQDVEPLMSDEQRMLGETMANENGVPMAPTANMATDKLVSDARRQERSNFQGILNSGGQK